MTLEEILKDIMGMSDTEYKDEQEITSLENFDSMNHMIFIATLEREFNIEFEPNDIMTMIRIGEIKKILESKGITTY